MFLQQVGMKLMCCQTCINKQKVIAKTLSFHLSLSNIPFLDHFLYHQWTLQSYVYAHQPFHVVIFPSFPPILLI